MRVPRSWPIRRGAGDVAPSCGVGRRPGGPPARTAAGHRAGARRPGRRGVPGRGSAPSRGHARSWRVPGRGPLIAVRGRLASWGVAPRPLGAERWASAAPASRSEARAEAGRRRLQADVRRVVLQLPLASACRNMHHSRPDPCLCWCPRWRLPARLAPRHGDHPLPCQHVSGGRPQSRAAGPGDGLGGLCPGRNAED